MDDWGSQNALLISPSIWRKMFKPLYKEYVQLAHSYNKKMLMHSDGHILEIIPDLIEIGIDAVNSQIFCMGLEELAQFAGKMTFWGEIDRQYILSQGSTTDVIEAVKNVKKTLFKNGDIIAECEFGPGAKPENVYTVFEAWNNL